MKSRLIVILMGLFILGLSLPAGGKVFWKWRPGTGHSIFDTTPGWQRVYQSNVRINGSQGRLEIMGCDETLARVITRLQAAFAAQQPQATFRQSDSAGWGLIRTSDTITRVLALNLGTAAQTVVFVLTQSPRDFERSLKPSPTHFLAKFAAYPGSSVQSFMEDETAAARLEMSTAPGHPESVLSFFDASFEQNGYHRLTADAGRATANAGIAIFQKDTSLYYVLVQSSSQVNESMITVLHKQLRME